ncbi:hypothetical protein ACHAXT_001007 [Thalassiosira profunda]
MGLCISAVEVVDDCVNDFLDRQSRYYRESQLAKEHLAKQNTTAAAANNNNASSGNNKRSNKRNNTNTNNSHLGAVLQSDLSPIYPSLPNAAQKCQCRSVYDGDTLTLEDGSKVRLLGIDTPEIKEKQSFALEAKEYTKKYCHGKDVWLTFEQAGGGGNDKNKDHYGRLLAHIWVPLGGGNGSAKKGRRRRKQSASNSQWICINEGLVASGLAHAYSPSGSKKVHNRDKLLALQKLAREHRRGQWSTYKDYEAIVTPSGSAFHKCKRNNSTESDCKFLARSKTLNIVAASEAYDRGLHPCRNCFG